MRTNRIVLLLVGFFIYLSGCAQDNLKFSSRNYAGITEGESGTSFQLQTINGMRYKTWFAGIGTGLDYYFQRSIPLFVSVAKFLPSAKTPFYFSGDIGINFPWERKGIYYFQDPGTSSPSLYWAGGLGYKFGFKKRNEGFLLNFGYSYKHLYNETEYTNPCLIPPCPVSKERYDYRLRRLSVKVGWMF
jgi:hypothetical protein